jgi:hypothetical protein
MSQSMMHLPAAAGTSRAGQGAAAGRGGAVKKTTGDC